MHETAAITATIEERKKNLLPLLFIFITLLALSALIVLFTPTTAKDIFTFSIGIMLYCFLPGYGFLMHLSLDTYQKVAFSVPLSIALVSLTVYLLNVLLFIPITLWSVLLSSIAYSIGGFFWPEIKGWVKDRFSKTTRER